MKKDVREHLERLQRRAMRLPEREWIPLTPERERELHRELEEALPDDVKSDEVLMQSRRRNDAEALALELPTPHEDRWAYSILMSAFQRIAKACERQNLTLVPPSFGTLAYGRINAVTYRISEGEYLVVFQRYLFWFALLLSKAISYAFPLELYVPAERRSRFNVDPDAVREHLEVDSTSADRFRELLHAYIIDGHPAKAPRYDLPLPRHSLAEPLLQSFELFVAGHEAVHIIRNHRKWSSTEPTAIAGDAEEVQWNWQQETEADLLGLKLMLTATGESGFQAWLCYGGADMYFSVQKILGEALRIFGVEIGRPSRSHPPPDQRMAKLRQAMRETADSGVLSFADQIVSILELLWTKTRPHFEQLAREGRQPASMWRVV